MKNQTITLDITDITPDGEGVGRHEGKVVFVPLTAPGDRCEALVLKERSSCTYAKLTKLLTPSELRKKIDCDCFEKCGGCTFRHIRYEEECRLKQQFVSNALSRIGGLDCEVLPTVFGDSTRYRNKVQYPLAQGHDGSCVFGYYARRSHRIVPHEECLLQDRIFCEIAKRFCTLCDRHGIKAFDEQTGNGNARHLVMRKNKKGQILLCIVAKDTSDRRWSDVARELKSSFDPIIGIHLNQNSKETNVIFGEKTLCILGEAVLTDTILDKSFCLSPRSFFQVNPQMTEKLYLTAKEKAAADDEDVILDLYCGAGTVGLCLAGEKNKLCGVEIIPEAVENAKNNAKINGRNEKNTLFVCGDAAKGAKECTAAFGKPDIILVDPPRKGLSAEVLQTVFEAAPKKIVYISCNPATLARDCRILADGGYSADSATPVDMFPGTGHVETVVMLSRK